MSRPDQTQPADDRTDEYDRQDGDVHDPSIDTREELTTCRYRPEADKQNHHQQSFYLLREVMELLVKIVIPFARSEFYRSEKHGRQNRNHRSAETTHTC